MPKEEVMAQNLHALSSVKNVSRFMGGIILSHVAAYATCSLPQYLIVRFMCGTLLSPSLQDMLKNPCAVKGPLQRTHGEAEHQSVYGYGPIDSIGA
jgi:hypothetical protein